MIKIRGEINEIEKTQEIEKINLEKNTNWHHGEIYQINMEEIRPILQKHFQKIGEN